jgi:hypothetical protein
MTRPTGTHLEMEIAMNSNTQVGAGATREEVSLPDSRDSLRYVRKDDCLSKIDVNIFIRKRT